MPQDHRNNFLARCRILHVTDDDAQHCLLMNILKPDNSFSIERIQTGIQALKALHSRATDQLPNLVIIPWIMPLLTSREFTTEMKSDERTRAIPLIVMSASLPSEEIVALYEAGVSCVVTTGTDYDSLCAALKALKNLWVDWVMLPYSRWP
ncbi:MAG TPA: response regulator [Bryobacteraceae bacterium]|nr:response regulator [Bryobacteraceae bacterium]